MIKHDHKRVVRGLHAEALGEVGVLAAVRSGHGAPPEDSGARFGRVSDEIVGRVRRANATICSR